MLNLVEARTNQGALLTLSLSDISSGFLIEDIDGLLPVKATLASSSFAGRDGAQYHSSKRETRNIKIKISLEPDYIVSSVKSLRNRLYEFFMPKSEVNLRFYDTEIPTVNISGIVESFESVLFSEQPEIDISIICFDPDFISMTPVEIDGSSTSGETEIIVNYDGTVETGILFVLNVNRSISDFTIYHNPPNGSLRSMDFSEGLINGDVLTISSVFGSKGAFLTRASTDSSILFGISPQSNWIELAPGLNRIRVYATGAPIPFEITYLARYGGL